MPDGDGGRSRIPLTVRTSVPAPGEEDMDWTEPFLERGTTMTFDADWLARPCEVPVTRAWVRDQILHLECQVLA